MTLDDIKADETYEKIKRWVMDREFWRKCLKPTSKNNTNDDEESAEDLIFFVNFFQL